jgi:hypothetical protein
VEKGGFAKKNKLSGAQEGLNNLIRVDYTDQCWFILVLEHGARIGERLIQEAYG